MPEGFPLASVETALLRRGYETRHATLIRGGEEERLVELAVGREQGIARAQSGIFRDLARTHLVKARHTHVAFLGNLIQCGRHLSIGPAQRHAEILPEAFALRDADVEISVRDEYSAAVFGNEGMPVFKLAAQRLYFGSRSRRHQDKRNATPLELAERFFSVSRRSAARVDQGAFDGGEDQMTGSKQDKNQCSATGAARIWEVDETPEAGRAPSSLYPRPLPRAARCGGGPPA